MPREVKRLTQGHTAEECRSQDLTDGSDTSVRALGWFSLGNDMHIYVCHLMSG